jgi:hypothetical protein
MKKKYEPAGWVLDENGEHPIEITRTYVRWYLEQSDEVKAKEDAGHHRLVINPKAFQAETTNTF